MHANTKSFSLIPGLQATVWWAVERFIYRASRQWRALQEARRADAARREAEVALGELADHELRDLGLTRDQIAPAVAGQLSRTR